MGRNRRILAGGEMLPEALWKGLAGETGYGDNTSDGNLKSCLYGDSNPIALS